MQRAIPRRVAGPGRINRLSEEHASVNEHDKAVEERDAALEAGFLRGEPTPSPTTDDVFGHDPVAEGWNVGKPDERPQPPAVPTQQEDDQLAARLGIDRQGVVDYLNENPGLEQDLVARGMIVAEPKSESDLLRNLAAIEKVQQAEANAAAFQGHQQQQALQLGLRAYEEGEDPAQIADLLLQWGPEVADAFTRHWEQEEGYVDDWEEPLTPDEWRTRARQQMEEDAAFEQFIQDAAAAQQAEAAQQQLQAEVEAAAHAFIGRTPNIERYSNEMANLIRQLDPAAVNSAEAASTAMEAAYLGSKELERARYAARILTEFDEDNAARSGYMEPRVQFDRHAALASNFAKSINPDAAANVRAVERFEQQLDRELFGDRASLISAEWDRLERSLHGSDQA
jgi:hypothetical protein